MSVGSIAFPKAVRKRIAVPCKSIGVPIYIDYIERHRGSRAVCYSVNRVPVGIWRCIYVIRTFGVRWNHTSKCFTWRLVEMVGEPSWNKSTAISNGERLTGLKYISGIKRGQKVR